MAETVYDGSVAPATFDKLVDASTEVTVRYDMASGETVELPTFGETPGYDALAASAAGDPAVTAYTADGGVTYTAIVDVDMDEEELEEVLDDLADAGKKLLGGLGPLDDLVDDVLDALPDNIDLDDVANADGAFVYEGELPSRAADDIL